MATIDVVPIRPLGVADLDAVQNLSFEAGWNQVEADWRIFLELGHLYGVDGPAGTVQVEVRFTVDADGILAVDATEMRTGKSTSTRVLASSGLTRAEVERLAAAQGQKAKVAEA